VRSTATTLATTGRKQPEPARFCNDRCQPPTPIDSGDHRDRVREKRDELVDAYTPMVRRVAERLKTFLPPCFELDDLIQTGLMALLRAAPRYRPDHGRSEKETLSPDKADQPSDASGQHGGAPFGPYARKVARGAMLDSIRGRHYRDATALPIGAGIDVAERPSIDEAIDRRRELARVDDAIEYLEPRRRSIIRAWYREGATLETASAEVGLSKSHTHELAHDALARLRLILHA
jgi:RNA polymerase sigma factor (sigma-70 family)